MPKKKPPAKKTTKKKRAAPQASESHQRKQERLEARRRAKEQALIAQRKRERRDRAVRSVVIVAVLAAVVWAVFLRQTAPTEIGGNEILSFSTSAGGQQTHAAPYTYDEETTGVNPPVSGRHDPATPICGVYTEKYPDQNLVHAFEHGAAAVLYDPKAVGEALSLQDVRQIEEIVTSYEDDTISAPYAGLSDPIVVASWSRKMPMNSFDAEDIREYIDTFRDTEPAPEASAQDCANEADEPYEPPEPSPSPTPTPTETEGADDNGGGANEQPQDGAPGDDDGSPDKGSGDAGEKDAPGDDDGTPDKGSGDN